MNPWTRYYFGISGNFLIQFKNSTKTEMIEKFHVGGCVVQEILDDDSMKRERGRKRKNEGEIFYLQIV
jgi:hypothetical protein